MAMSRLVMGLTCALVIATVGRDDATDGARSCAAFAPELLAEFARVVVANDAGDLAAIRAHDGYLLGEQLTAQVGREFPQRELDRGPFSVGDHVRDLPARGRIGADDGSEIGNDLVGGSYQLPVGKCSKRGMIGERRSQATGIAGIYRSKEF